jgi:hypothetical protein
MLGTQGSVVSRDQSTALSRGTANRVVAIVSGPLFLDHHVVAPLRELLDRYGVGLTARRWRRANACLPTTRRPRVMHGGHSGRWDETRLP